MDVRRRTGLMEVDMKKIFCIIVIGLFLLSLNGQAFAGSCCPGGGGQKESPSEETESS